MIRAIETLGKTYELHLLEDRVVVEIFGTCYEISEREHIFSVYRVESDGLACGIGDANSEVAAIELAEIFERLAIYVLNTGLCSELQIIRAILNEWESHPPRKINFS